MNQRTSRHGFTLIELLVVVAIITLLIAILLPSLSRARYVAKLTVCATQLRQISLGAINYALGNTNFYPYRPTSDLTSSNKPNLIKLYGYDDRPYLRDYIDLNQLIDDPLGEHVDWANSNPSTGMEAPYHLFFGYGYKTPNEKPMKRIGDTWTWQNNQFHILAGDRDVINFGGSWVHGSHPDRDGVMGPERLEEAAAGNVPGSSFTLFRWISYSTSMRGLIDMNFAYDDGSVQPFGNVQRDDERMTPVPEFSDGGNFPVAPTFVPAHR